MTTISDHDIAQLEERSTKLMLLMFERMLDEDRRPTIGVPTQAEADEQRRQRMAIIAKASYEMAFAMRQEAYFALHERGFI